MVWESKVKRGSDDFSLSNRKSEVAINEDGGNWEEQLEVPVRHLGTHMGHKPTSGAGAGVEIQMQGVNSIWVIFKPTGLDKPSKEWR